MKIIAFPVVLDEQGVECLSILAAFADVDTPVEPDDLVVGISEKAYQSLQMFPDDVQQEFLRKLLVSTAP